MTEMDLPEVVVVEVKFPDWIDGIIVDLDDIYIVLVKGSPE